MVKLLIATTNRAKLNELTKFLKDLPLKLVSLKDLNITQKIEETGKTLEENAIIKAKFYQKLSGLPTLSDDAGFEIDYLNGEPGVKAHRWIYQDREATDEEIINYALLKLKNVLIEKRGAKLRIVLALAINQNKIITKQAELKGVVGLTIANKPNLGFPYRSLLYLPQIKKFYNDFELTEDEDKQYNHRRKAIDKLIPVLKKLLIDS